MTIILRFILMFLDILTDFLRLNFIMNDNYFNIYFYYILIGYLLQNCIYL